MKTAISSMVVACALFSLVGCNNRTEAKVLRPTRTAELKPMQQSWCDTLPCTDCEGIEISLLLEEDGMWVMNEHYQGVRDEPSLFVSYGIWARVADKLMLTDSKGEESYCRTKSGALEMLNREGNPIESQFSYTLQPASASLPVAPVSMRGMYFYMADMAIFTDYATGKRMPVANSTQLERNYLATHAENGWSVPLTLEAYFTPESNPDMGEKAKMLMADKDVKFIPGKACS